MNEALTPAAPVSFLAASAALEAIKPVLERRTAIRRPETERGAAPG